MQYSGKRRETKSFTIGDVGIGSAYPVSIQSMTNTDTRDAQATLVQIRQLADAGCQMVRVAVPDEEAANALKQICAESPVPVIADIHFNHRLALMAMDNAEKGEVLFIYTYGKPASVWGELASTCAGEKGIAGTVLYGWARDMDALVDLDYPVFALDYLPNAGKALGLGEINIDLEIYDDVIKPGDFVFGDQNGVVVIPKELFHETMVATFNVKVKESHIIKELKKGRLLSEIIGLNR